MTTAETSRVAYAFLISSGLGQTLRSEVLRYMADACDEPRYRGVFTRRQIEAVLCTPSGRAGVLATYGWDARDSVDHGRRMEEMSKSSDGVLLRVGETQNVHSNLLNQAYEINPNPTPEMAMGHGDNVLSRQAAIERLIEEIELWALPNISQDSATYRRLRFACRYARNREPYPARVEEIRRDRRRVLQPAAPEDDTGI